MRSWNKAKDKAATKGQQAKKKPEQKLAGPKRKHPTKLRG